MSGRLKRVLVIGIGGDRITGEIYYRLICGHKVTTPVTCVQNTEGTILEWNGLAPVDPSYDCMLPINLLCPECPKLDL